MKSNAVAFYSYIVLGATFLLSAFFLVHGSFVWAGALADNDEVQAEIKLYYFDDPLCPVCQSQKEFLPQLESEYDNLTIKTYKISETQKLESIIKDKGIDDDYRIMAPTTIVGDSLLQFNEFGEVEKDALRSAIEGEKVHAGQTFAIPWSDRRIEPGDWSLPVLAAVLGSIDGFNVCSLGALILILSIVLAFDSRRKIFAYGGIFILTTVLVYGGLVFVWGQILDAFIAQLGVLRLLIGLAALGGSVYFFREFWRFYKFGPSCKSSESKLAKNSSNRLTKALQNQQAGAAAIAGSIMLFAAVITIVELPCSIGVPLAFSGIVVESGVSTLAYAGYIGIYLAFYMLIELIVFTGAVLSKRIWFAGSQMITWVTLIAALILLALAGYYLLSL